MNQSLVGSPPAFTATAELLAPSNADGRAHPADRNQAPRTE